MACVDALQPGFCTSISLYPGISAVCGILYARPSGRKRSPLVPKSSGPHRPLRAPQFELYSSRVKEFEVRGRQSHPRTDGVEYSRGLDSPAWKLLGNYTAEKTKGTQSFGVDPAAWVRYLLLRFVSHHGTEPVCALNAFSVFGELGGIATALHDSRVPALAGGRQHGKIQCCA